MENLKSSIILKTICYITIPIMVAIIIMNCIVGIAIAKEPDVLDEENIYNTDSFGSTYNSALYHLSNIVQYVNNQEKEDISSTGYYNYYDYEKYTNSNNEKIIYDIYTSIDLNYVVIDKQTNTVYTNISITANTDTIDKLKSYIRDEKTAYWNFSNGEINTNIKSLKKENLSYSSRIHSWVESENNNYEIYTTLNEGKGLNSDFWEIGFIYKIMQPISQTPYIAISIVLTILTIIACVYLIVSLGNKKGYEGVYLNWLDKIPLEFIIVIFFIGMAIAFGFLNNYSSMSSVRYTIFILGCTFAVTYVTLAIVGTTFVKRIKAHTTIQNTLIYRMFIWATNLMTDFFSNSKLIVKLGIIYGGFVLIFFILMLMSASYYDFGFPIFLLVILVCFAFVKLYNYIKKIYKVKDAIKNIYEGNNEITLNPDEMRGELKEVSVHVNDIAGGFSNAIQESIKSERFKTELITNVSHDIKTPLTSIINYVDLLKQEKIDNDKANEYIQILEQKSQRLKKLTEDLVEASKASSGNVKLEMEKINIVELIKQATGEFEDKFEEKNLKIITQMPDNEVNIMADNRYIYRVIENLFSNISKYALDNSRVYIDVIKENGKAIITIKNISKDSLNITADELMQRFVRGDKSRTTEGSGLGLSISKSLTEIQKGTFTTQIDGDLFKVEIIFELV